jgi:hypothetical protein
MAAECQGRLNGEAPALTDAERKQRQRSREKAAQDEIERLRLVAEAKAKLIAEYVYTPPKDHTGALKSLQSRNWESKGGASDGAPGVHRSGRRGRGANANADPARRTPPGRSR